MTCIKMLLKKRIILFHNGRKREKARRRIGLLNTEEEIKNKQGLFIAVLDSVQKDIATQIEKAALKSNDPWQQLIFACVGFVDCANAKPNRRILLVDAPSVLGWDTWRKVDQENSMQTLQKQIDDLKAWGYLCDDVDTSLMTCAVSGALNELALNYSQDDAVSTDRKIFATVSQLVNGFRRKKC